MILMHFQSFLGEHTVDTKYITMCYEIIQLHFNGKPVCIVVSETLF